MNDLLIAKLATIIGFLEDYIKMDGMQRHFTKRKLAYFHYKDKYGSMDLIYLKIFLCPLLSIV